MKFAILLVTGRWYSLQILESRFLNVINAVVVVIVVVLEILYEVNYSKTCAPVSETHHYYSTPFFKIDTKG